MAGFWNKAMILAQLQCAKHSDKKWADVHMVYTVQAPTIFMMYGWENECVQLQKCPSEGERHTWLREQAWVAGRHPCAHTKPWKQKKKHKKASRNKTVTFAAPPQLRHKKVKNCKNNPASNHRLKHFLVTKPIFGRLEKKYSQRVLMMVI